MKKYMEEEMKHYSLTQFLGVVSRLVARIEIPAHDTIQKRYTAKNQSDSDACE